VLLEMARVFTKDPKYKPKVNVWLLFIDGEESVEWHWKDERALLGSKHFVKTMNDDKKLFPNGLKSRMKAFVLLDLIGSKDFKIDRDLKSSKALQDIFAETAKGMGVADRVYEFTSEFTDDHDSFTAYRIPSVLLIDFEFRVPFADRGPRFKMEQRHPRDDDYVKWWHTAEDKIENMDPEALSFTGNLVLQAWARLEAFCGIK
jgi:glutaminyl-peptide cyclotransferase